MEKKVFFEKTVNGRWLSNFIPVSHIGSYMYECYLQARSGDKVSGAIIARPKSNVRTEDPLILYVMNVRSIYDKFSSLRDKIQRSGESIDVERLANNWRVRSIVVEACHYVEIRFGKTYSLHAREDARYEIARRIIDEIGEAI